MTTFVDYSQELSARDAIYTATISVVVNLVSFTACSHINTQKFECFIKLIIPLMLLWIIFDGVVMGKTRNPLTSIIGMLLFLYLVFFYGLYFLFHMQIFETPSIGLVFLPLFFLVFAYPFISNAVFVQYVKVWKLPRKMKRQPSKYDYTILTGYFIAINWGVFFIVQIFFNLIP